MIGHSVVSFLLQASPGNPGNMTSDQQFQIAMEALKHSGPTSGLLGVLALLVPFASFAMIVAIVWLWYRQRQAQMQAQAEFHKQLLEKFGSGKEFAEFLEGQGGQRFLETMWTQSRGGFNHILRMMRTGIVMTVVGVGLLALSWTDRGQRGLHLPAVIVLGLGVGFLLSAAISHRLSKQWEQKASTEGPRVP